MIINEKYIRDIDDEDDDFDDGMSQTRHISDKTTFEHYVTVSIENTYFKVQPSKFMFNRRLQQEITYDYMNEIYDRIDSCIESIMPISDYKIKIDMRFKSEDYVSRADVDPPYDSDDDYGTVGGFLPEQEVIHDIRFHVGFDANHMHFEHINTLVHCLVDAIFDMKNHTYNVTGPIYMSMLHFVVDDIKFSVQQNDLTHKMRAVLGDKFKSKVDRHKAEDVKPKSLKYTDNAHMGSTSEKSVGEIKFGDLLYETDGGELVSQAINKDGSKNTPIAINILPGRFMSLRFMSLYNPSVGTKRFNPKECLMPYGSKGTKQEAYLAPLEHAKYGNTLSEETSDYSGNQDYDAMLSYMNKSLKTEDVHMTYLPNSSVKGLLQGAFCTYLFHTKATKSGQWYIPSPSEIHYAFGRQTLVAWHSGDYVKQMVDQRRVVSKPDGARFNNIQVLMWRFENEYHMKMPWMLKDEAPIRVMTSREQDRNHCATMEIHNKAHICTTQSYTDKDKLVAVLPFIRVNP